jgi:hypothetical protein
MVLTSLASAPARAASAAGGQITRAEVIARAQYWVDHQPGNYLSTSDQSTWRYGPTADVKYRRDCSGYVSMAWHLTTNPSSATLVNYSTQISIAQLKAGDILDIPGTHVALFDRWIDANGNFYYYTFGSTPVKHVQSNINNKTLDSHPFGSYQARRYNNLAPDNASPIGVLDSATSNSAGTITVTGWAFDPDVPTTNVGIHVYVGGPAGSGAAGYNVGVTSVSRPDVKNVYPQTGTTSGFTATVTAPGGSIPVYVYAIDANGGDNTLLSARTVAVANPNPEGVFDSVTSPAAGKIKVQGWAFDRSNPATKIHIHVYVGGAAGSGAPGYDIGATSVARPDVAKAVAGAGPTTGFNQNVSGTKGTSTTVYVYAINVGVGTNTFLGSRQVFVSK